MSTEAVEHMSQRLHHTAWIAAAVVLVSTVFSGLPSGTAEATAVIAVTVLSVLLFLVGAKGGGNDLTCASLYTATGICGAVVIGLEPDGPGFVVTFMAMAALGLRLPRRLAVQFGAVVVVAASIAEAVASSHPVSGVLDIVLGAGFLLLASAYAAASLESHSRSLELLQQEEATREARGEAAALAERGRLARELHDVLAHTLSGLTLQLEGARLLADRTHADAQLVEQISHAGRLAREGLNGAKRAVSTLRGDALPGPAELPDLVDNACRSGLLATFQAIGGPQRVRGRRGGRRRCCRGRCRRTGTRPAGRCRSGRGARPASCRGCRGRRWRCGRRSARRSGAGGSRWWSCRRRRGRRTPPSGRRASREVRCASQHAACQNRSRSVTPVVDDVTHAADGAERALGAGRPCSGFGCRSARSTAGTRRCLSGRSPGQR